MLDIDFLKSINLDKLDMIERGKILQLIEEIKLRKEEFGIVDFTAQEHQEKVIQAVGALGDDNLPIYKYFLFQGGNGSGKSITGCYIDILKALGREGCKKYNLPFIGEAKQILVVVQSSNAIKTNVEPYFLGPCSKKNPFKIPSDEIKKVVRDKEFLKSIELKNGAKILFQTYEQGYERLEGSNPDFIHLDEFPSDDMVFYTLLRGTRGLGAQLLITATPNSGIKNATYNWFHEQDDIEVLMKSWKIRVNSMENIFGDHTWLRGLPDNVAKARSEGLFVPASGLVYENFDRYFNVIEHFNPSSYSGWKFYGAIDFGVVHPMVFLLIGVDRDGHIYIFDMIYEKGMLIGDFAYEIVQIQNRNRVNLEYIVADSAGKREREELKSLGIHTIPADKFSKGENDTSNRTAGILKINMLLSEGMIVVSERCTDLINEFETHHWMGNGTDKVEKTDDDALDALRYFIFSYLGNITLRDMQKDIKRLQSTKTKRVDRY